jgi:capsular exopolysaccharide synthesis family protein
MTKNQASQLVPEASRQSRSPSESPVARLMKLTPMESEMNLVSILRMIKRRKWTLILTVLVLPALAMIAILQTTPRYTATGTVIIEPKSVNIGDIDQVLNQGRPDVRIDSQIEIVRSRGLANRTIERLFLDTRPEFNPGLREAGWRRKLQDTAFTSLAPVGVMVERWVGVNPIPQPAPKRPGDREAVIDEFSRALEVSVIGKSSVLEISFTSEDRQLTAQVVRTLSDLYIDDQLEVKFEAMKRTQLWLNKRLESLKDQVNNSEAAIAKWRKEKGLIRGTRSDLITEQISRLSDQRLDAQSQLSTIQASLAQLRAFADNPVGLESLPQVLDYPVIRDLRGQESSLKSEEAQLGSRVGPRHPDLIKVRAQLATLATRVVEEIRRVGRGLETEEKSALSKHESLTVELRRARSRAAQANASGIRLRALEREASANQTLLQTFMERSKETAEVVELEQSDARVLSQAYAPSSPSYPRKGLIMGTAIGLSLLFGLLLVYLRELLDHTFRSSDEVESALGLPCLGIPKVGKPGWRVSIYDYVIAKPTSVYAETIRSLRTSLWLHGAQEMPRSVVLTSSRAGEGKTTTAVSLARVAALSGERVILVDCDLRRSSVQTALKAPAGSRGLLDLLSGEATRLEVTQTDAKVENVQYITAGSHSHQSAKLLMSDNMAALVRELRSEYDLVILDAPPTMAISDARILATLADTVIYCVQWRETVQSVVMNGVRALTSVGANVTGIALTQVNFKMQARSEYVGSEEYARGYSGYFK